MASSSGQPPHRYVGYRQAPSEEIRPAPGSRSHQQRLKQQQQQQQQHIQQQPVRQQQGRQQQGRQQQAQHSSVTHHHSRDVAVARHREEFDRNGRLLTLGTVFMFIGLIIYFGGGFLFVAAYNGIYPIINKAVDPSIHRYYWWIGPICFFIGLIMFIIAFATFCKGLKCNGGRTVNEEGYF